MRRRCSTSSGGKATVLLMIPGSQHHRFLTRLFNSGSSLPDKCTTFWHIVAHLIGYLPLNFRSVSLLEGVQLEKVSR